MPISEAVNSTSNDVVMGEVDSTLASSQPNPPVPVFGGTEQVRMEMYAAWMSFHPQHSSFRFNLGFHISSP